MKNVKSVFSLFILLAVLAIGLAYRPVSVKADGAKCDCTVYDGNGDVLYGGVYRFRPGPSGDPIGYCNFEECGSLIIE